MIDVQARRYEIGDLERMDIQDSQQDWIYDLSPDAEKILAGQGHFFSFCQNEKVLAVGGVIVLEEGPMFVCVLSDEAKRRSKTLYLFARAALRTARETGFAWLFTHTDEGDPVQERWVSRLGFEPVGPITAHNRPMIRWEIEI